MDFIVDGCQAFAYTGARALESRLPTLLFVHGAANDHSVWALQSRYFAHHGRNVLAVDLPGHGRSAGAPLDNIAALADWLMALLDAAHIERAAIVGHSMGSLAALDASARYVGRIDKIALLGTAVPMPVSEQLLSAARANEHAALDMITLWGHAPASHIGGHTVPGVWMLGAHLRVAERAARDVLFTDLQACNAYANGLERALQATCPALIMVGERDAMTPARATQRIVQALPNARTVIIKNAGHAMMLEQPDHVLDTLIEFL